MSKDVTANPDHHEGIGAESFAVKVKISYNAAALNNGPDEAASSGTN